MANTLGYYDIDCGTDVNLVKFAADNGDFHYIRIHADVAKTIDFSGGIRNIETIVLEKCFKLGRIIWPYHTGAIRQLYINSASMLTRLDISALTQLEYLYIIGCPALKEIKGLSSQLKEICIHHVKVDNIDLRDTRRIQVINISTLAPQLKISAKNLNNLQQVFLSAESKKTQTSIDCDLSNCTSLFRLAVDAGESAVNLQVQGCLGLKECQMSTGTKLSISGLSDCMALEYLAINDLH